MKPKKANQRCTHCKQLRSEHVEKQCLFSPTAFKNMSPDERVRFDLGSLVDEVKRNYPGLVFSDGLSRQKEEVEEAEAPGSPEPEV